LNTLDNLCYNERVEFLRKGRLFIYFIKQKTMKKPELVDAVMQANGIETKKKAQEIVDSVFDIITKTMGRGEEVAVPGFGVFRATKRAARQGRNPKTGETIQIAASTKPKFRAAKQLKEAVL